MAELLPTEVIVHVMDYLNLSDYRMASLVSKSWYRASRDFLLVKKFVLVFGSTATPEDIVNTLSNTRAINVVLDSFDYPVSLKSHFVSNFCNMFESVQSLSLKNCSLTDAVLMAILVQCKALRHLDITSCNSFFMTGNLFSKEEDKIGLASAFKDVRGLTLTSLKYISDLMLDRFLFFYPSLQHLNLAGNSIIFHSNEYYESKKCEGEKVSSSAILTFAHIVDILQANYRNVQTLNFGRTAINTNAISTMSSIKGLQLQELYLACCQEVDDNTVMLICENQPLLTVLDLSECLSVTDVSLTAIVSHLEKLRKLLLAKCRQITELSVCKLKKLQQLEHLDLNACHLITSNGLRLGLCSGSIKYLTYLKLTCCSSVHDDFVVEASQLLTQLKVLDLSSCKIGNAAVLAISRHLTNLCQLYLAWCQDITDDGLLGIKDFQNQQRKQIHDDEYCLCRCTRQHNHTPVPKPLKSVLDAAPVEQTPSEPGDIYPISHLRKLVLLDLTSCRRLTDLSVVNVMKFSEMKKLHLSLIPGITDRSLSAISLGIPTLEDLHLSQCVKLTDVGMLEVTTRLKRLSLLNVSSCDQLTNRTLESLCVDPSNLKYLDVSFCSHISIEAVDMLEYSLKQLHTVHKRHIGTKAY